MSEPSIKEQLKSLTKQLLSWNWQEKRKLADLAPMLEKLSAVLENVKALNHCSEHQAAIKTLDAHLDQMQIVLGTLSTAPDAKQAEFKAPMGHGRTCVNLMKEIEKKIESEMLDKNVKKIGPRT